MKKFNKYKELSAILIIGVIIASITILINSSFSEKSEDAPQAPIEEIDEPDAPPAENIQIEEYSTENIEHIEFSPDQTKAAALVKTNIDGEYRLEILDSNGGLIEEISDQPILEAKFIDNNNIYYQQTGENFGIFLYELGKGTSKKIVSSTDPDYFNSLAFINTSKYFFIQPKTGKYGYGDINSGTEDITGQEAIPQQGLEEKNSALFENPAITNDGKLLMVFKRVITEQTAAYIFQTYSIEDLKLTNPLNSIEVSTDFNSNYPVKLQGKYVIFGTDSAVFDTEKMEIIYRGKNEQVTSIEFSPDQSKKSICTGTLSNRNCTIEENGNISHTLPRQISQSKWLNNDTLIYTIGQSIYEYDINTKTNKKITDERNNFEILAQGSGFVLTKKNDQVLKVSLKNN